MKLLIFFHLVFLLCLHFRTDVNLVYTILVVCAEDCEIWKVAPLIYLNTTEKSFHDGNQYFQFSQSNFLLPVESLIPLVILNKSFDLIVPVSSQLDNWSKKQLFTENWAA